MATLLLNLRHVPEDEAEAVRGLLSRNGLEYYETPPNRWGISMGAIWLATDDDAPRAKALLADYQAERQRAAREAFHQARAEGRVEGIATRLRRQPLALLGRMAAALAVLYLTVGPFLGLL